MSTNSSDPVIAVFEPRPYWGPELQRQLKHTSIVVRECRAVSDLMPAIDGCQSALLVIDLDAALVDCLAWLGSEARSEPVRRPIIACGSTTTAELEWLLRDAGVTSFLPDLVNGEELARLCCRQLGWPRWRPAIR